MITDGLLDVAQNALSAVIGMLPAATPNTAWVADLEALVNPGVGVFVPLDALAAALLLMLALNVSVWAYRTVIYIWKKVPLV
jgi:hypothetical protein